MIKYNAESKTFILNTNETCYAFKIAHDKFPVHLYYGDKENPNLNYSEEGVNFSIVPNGEKVFSLDSSMLEFSGFGVGDYRTTSVKIRSRKNNGDTCFLYSGYKIFDGARAIDCLPYAKSGNGVKTLEIKLRDETLNCNLYLYYTVYPDCDVIVRSAKVENSGTDDVSVENCMSLCLDLKGNDFDVITLSGCYAKEMQRNRNPLFSGSQRVFSRRGATGHNYNPFMAICDKGTDYQNGNVYAVNLIYSGDFVTEAETSSVSLEKSEYSLTRIQTGINSENFAYKLSCNEIFDTPLGILTYSKNGFNGLSENLHKFIRKYLLTAHSTARPIVLNTWEACFFDIEEEKLLRLARECANVGIDTLVVDDGWFGHRNDDKSSLGDWFSNDKKFPDGIGKFAEKVRACGVNFGLWIEPEMISADSELFKKKPQWVLGNPNRALSAGRNQFVLDLTNPEVIDYLKNELGKLFIKTGASYIKWDMNRNLSEVGSVYLPRDRQRETSFRYMLGVYDLLKWLQTEFPEIILETCSGGGGRYDLGMMSFSSMIWCSDNTYPERRAYIQNGALSAYPSCVMSAHISNPDGVCEDIKELDYRYAVAVQGQLGFEMDLSKVSDEMKNRIRELIADYKQIRKVISGGRYFVLYSPYESEFSVFGYATEMEIFVDIVRVGQAKEACAAIKLFDVDPNATYTERYSGNRITGKCLVDGIKIETGKDEKFNLLLHYIKD